ncbi:MAG: hypothetical protein GVY30_11975 [Chloroflexi bacterium]|jgi:hypothetical protein|nr:hypothetical protein [Chloroflexota bacterium]
MSWVLALLGLGVVGRAAIGKPMKTGIWEGMLSFGANPGVSNFDPCTPKREVWWLKGKRYTDIEEEIRRRHAELTESPYEKVYGRFEGQQKQGAIWPFGHLPSRFLRLRDFGNARRPNR